jgi:hypothetical protein
VSLGPNGTGVLDEVNKAGSRSLAGAYRRSSPLNSYPPVMFLKVEILSLLIFFILIL